MRYRIILRNIYSAMRDVAIQTAWVPRVSRGRVPPLIGIMRGMHVPPLFELQH